MTKNILQKLTIIALSVQCLLPGCAKVERKEDLDLSQLKEKATVCLRNQDYEAASEFLQLMISKFPEDPKIGNYKISLANCKFNNREYEQAFQLYESFHQYYPSDKRAEYAKYKAALSKYHQALDFDRDQTFTENAIRACSAYEEIPTYQKYRQEISNARNKCVQKLIDKEISICKFYIKHGKTNAANKRLEQARKLYGTHEDLDAHLLYLECKLANKTNDNDLLEKKKITLSRQYPSSPYAKMVKNITQKNNTFIF